MSGGYKHLKNKEGEFETVEEEDTKTKKVQAADEPEYECTVDLPFSEKARQLMKENEEKEEKEKSR
jgi:hypothetical protein